AGEDMSKVFVRDQARRSLDPVHPGYARWLRAPQKAAVWRRFPLTSTLTAQQPGVPVRPLRLKVDPGSKNTGLTLLAEATGAVVWATELRHRGGQVCQHLAERRAVGRNRRQRKTRCRTPRFAKGRRRAGWMAPSLASRVPNVLTWAARLARLCPGGALWLEL